MNIIEYTEHEFERVFNERNFNPSNNPQFEEEYDRAAQHVRNVISKYLSDETFLIYDGINDTSRFIDVSCSTEGYLNAALLIDLQQSLNLLADKWMVCLWEACYIFVTPKCIFGFDPTSSDPLFNALKKPE